MLKPEYEAFAVAVVEGATQTEAYQTHVAKPGTNHRSVVNAAVKLINRADVKDRIAQLRAAVEKRLAEQEPEKIEAIYLTIDAKRKWLKRLIETNPATFDPATDGDLLAGTRRNKFGEQEFLLPDKLAAMRIDNDFPGGGGSSADLLTFLRQFIRPGPTTEQETQVKEIATW